MREKNIYERVLSWEEVSIKEKFEAAKWLVAEKVANILQREIVVAKLSWEKSKVKLKARDCTDPDESIRKYLTILWAKNVKVTSDFPCWRAWESYEWSTSIEFDY